jgi:hypothetical protein
MEDFLEELGKPAEAYRGTSFFRYLQSWLVNFVVLVNLQDVRKGLTELRDGLKAIRQELKEYFSDVEQNDRYSKQMWGFLGKATRQMEDLIDDVNAADTLFTEVVKYFGEDDKNMSSAEFYGIFKTFITSYRVRDFTSSFVQIFDDGGENRNVRWRTEQPPRRSSRWRGEGKPLRMQKQVGRKQQRVPLHKKPRRPLLLTTCLRSCETVTISDDALVVRVPALSARKNRPYHLFHKIRTYPPFRRWAALLRTLHGACWNSSRRTALCPIHSRRYRR